MSDRWGDRRHASYPPPHVSRLTHQGPELTPATGCWYTPHSRKAARGSSSGAERQLPKLNVVGSNPISRFATVTFTGRIRIRRPNLRGANPKRALVLADSDPPEGGLYAAAASHRGLPALPGARVERLDRPVWPD